MANPRPTPTALKLMRGNPGQRKLNAKEPKVEKEIPNPPPHLTDEESLAEWERMTEVLYGMGVLSRVDANALALYCDTHSAYVRAKTDIEENGFESATHNGSIIQRPCVAVFHRTKADMVKLLCEFGMTPASRTKVSIIESKKDQLDDFLDSTKG